MTEGFEAGADDYISKSADFSVTKARMRALLRRKFLVEENRRIFEEIRQKELEAVARARRAAKPPKYAPNWRINWRPPTGNWTGPIRNWNSSPTRPRMTCRSRCGKCGSSANWCARNTPKSLMPRPPSSSIICVDGADRMHQLIEDLLAYARASRAADGAVETADLNTIVDRALESLRAAIEDTHATIVCKDLPTVAVETIRIQQLFQNLIGNALKYRRPEEAPRIEISAQAGVNEWTVSVQDNGVGIDPEYFGKIFEPFARIDPNQHTGTGLGLAICKRIVEHSGGRIWVDSVPFEGSTFRFTIPARTPFSHS